MNHDKRKECEDNFFCLWATQYCPRPTIEVCKNGSGWNEAKGEAGCGV